MRYAILPALLALLPGAAPVAVAQAYPEKTVRIVVPFAPGGSTDILARLSAQKLNASFGKPVIVENRPGTGGHIGADYVAKSAPDGYTLLTAGIPQAIGMSLFKNLPYHLDRDLTPITNLATFPSVIAVHPSLPSTSVKNLLDLAKRRPGELNFGAVNGSPNHLAIVLLNVMAKTKMVHIPYKGGAPVVIDLVAGHIQVASMGLPPAVRMVQAGKLRPLAVTGATRSPVLPKVPTVQESGVPGYVVTSWYGMFAPAGTPAPILAKLHGELTKALKSSDIQERLAKMGADASGLGLQDFGNHVRTEIKKWAGVVEASGARAN